jgi:hypothetical protein
MKLTILALMVGAAAAFAPSNTVRLYGSVEGIAGRNPVAFFSPPGMFLDNLGFSRGNIA